ncbi:hypothetical protein Bca101_004468 [Brassica carinata]
MKEIGVLCIGYSRRRRKPATSLSLWLPETEAVGDMYIRRLSETKESGEISLMVAVGVFRKTVNGDISLLVALGDEGTRWLSLRRSMESSVSLLSGHSAAKITNEHTSKEDAKCCVAPQKTISSEKMSQKVTPSMNSLKSLPADYRFDGSSVPRKGGLRNGVSPSDTAAEDSEDSPYSGDVEHQSLANDMDTDAATVTLPQSDERRWSDTSAYARKKILQSWIQLPNGKWELGKILSTSGEESVLSLAEGKVSHFLVSEDRHELIFQVFDSALIKQVIKVMSETLVPANPDILDGVDDLMQLSYLNEPSVLYNLNYRYNQDMIYTKAGPVLVAVNPFKEVPLYGSRYIEAYRKGSNDSPHVYAIADTAIREMIRGGIMSGAGKTETAKIAMQYLAALGGGSGIEYEILKTNPIIEAFGNAKTLRNDNSSRFEALDIVHVSKEDQESVFAMLAAVLWLGNVSFTVIDNENHVEPVAYESLLTVAKLIGCNSNDLKLSLSKRNMRVGKDTIVQKLTLPQAIDARDALAKSIYSCLFDWLVEQINKSLAVGKRRTGRSISILDIYGFESFDKNSFEQFCINYANERLQQHFNRHLFKLEQEEYIQDGIDWTRVDFEDNQDCLSLFEKKPLGLLSLLDEESTFPNGTDLTLANKLKQHLLSNSCFRGDRGKLFTVVHYAGEVTYETTGFLEKNRDFLHLDSIQLLSSCSCHLPQAFASSMLIQSEKPVVGPLHKAGGADSQRLSVATKFKGQLFQLMQRLGNTTPHFIRCIKPNNVQSPGLYEQGLVLQQLRCCGVLEVVRISRSGFPTRMSHQKFARRYGFLLVENNADKDPLSVSVAILHQFNILPEMYQVGYTKLFFRTGQIGVLEDTRNRTLHGILRVQSSFRGYKARCHLKELRMGIYTLQSCITLSSQFITLVFLHLNLIVPPLFATVVRGEKVRKEFAYLRRRHRAAATIQSQVKSKIARQQYKGITEASLVIQSAIRGWLVRRCSGDIGWLKSGEVLVKASVLSELQRRVLKSEAALREKEEENDILQQRLQQYENRWSEYETKMKSMEEIWQKQMRSLQSSLSIAKKSLAVENSARNSDASVNASDWDSGSNQLKSQTSKGGGGERQQQQQRPMSAGLSVIGRLAEEFEQRAQVFGDDAKFLVEVKSGQVEANLNPDRELRRLKQMFETWKKDYGGRLRETKMILSKLGSEESGGSMEKVKRKWWGRRNSTRGAVCKREI